MDHRQALLDAIEAEPLDHPLRCVFADWLDEHGEVEEATRQREWVGAYKYLLENFAEPEWEYGSSLAAEAAEATGDAEAAELKDYLDAYGQSLSHEQVMEMIDSWQRSLVEEGGICFGGGAPVEDLYDEKHRNEFYRSIEVVTGVKILPETRERAGFRCAC